MKTQLETIKTDHNSSFSIMMNPRLNHLFYWHFHPEYELVYIEGANGTRHVGNHISNYKNHDLVFIGSYIPHLNFDYGVDTDYEKVVLHIQPQFNGQVLKGAPELKAVYELFEKSQYGIAFGRDTIERIGPVLKVLHTLPAFDQFVEIIRMFKLLSESDDYELLHEEPYVNHSSKKEKERLQSIYAFVEDNYQEKIEVDYVAGLCNLTKSAFCRYFKNATGNTFINFLNQYRISEAKKLLIMGKNISEVCFECGFESLSYFNRTFKKITKENPSDFKRKVAQ